VDTYVLIQYGVRIHILRLSRTKAMRIHRGLDIDCMNDSGYPDILVR